MFFSRYPFAAFQVHFFSIFSLFAKRFVFFFFVSFRERASSLEKEKPWEKRFVCFSSMWMECFLFSFCSFLLRMGLIWWLVGWLVGWLAGWLVGCLARWLVDWLVGWLVGDNIGLFRWWKARVEGAAAGAGDGNYFLLGG